MTTILDLKKENAELEVTLANLSKLANRLLATVYVLQDAVKSNTSGNTFRAYAEGGYADFPADYLPIPSQ